MFYQSTHLDELQAKVGSLFALIALWNELWILIGFVFLAIAVDFYFGYRLSRKVKIMYPSSLVSGKLESGKWWHTIIKGKDAAIFIGMIYLFDSLIFKTEECYLTRLVTGFIVGSELLSILENIAYISDALWAKRLRKYVKNKVLERYHVNIDENEF